MVVMMPRIPRPMSGTPKPPKKKIAVTGSPAPKTSSRRAVSYTTSSAGRVKAPAPAARGRRSTMAKSDANAPQFRPFLGRVVDGYGTDVGKGLPSILRGSKVALGRSSSSDGYAASRIKANMAGRAAGRKKAAGDSVSAQGLVNIGSDSRTVSRYASRSRKSRRGVLSPRQAQAMGFNTYRNPLSKV